MRTMYPRYSSYNCENIVRYMNRFMLARFKKKMEKGEIHKSRVFRKECPSRNA